MQTVEQLSLVLVDPFDLDVKHGVGVDLHLVVLLQVHGELHLVLLRVQTSTFQHSRSRRHVHPTQS